MKRIMLATLIALTGFTPNAVASGKGPCTADRYEVHHSDTTAKQTKATKALIRCAVRRWPVEGGAAKAIAVADCESSFYVWASANSNEGIYQINNWPNARATWLAHRHWYFPRWVNTSWKPPAFNERANVIVAIRWAHSLGWSAWSCA
jgi:hypothetical protein